MENNTNELIEIEDNISKDLNVEKIHETVLQITNKFKYEIMRCIKCPIILECSYPRKRLQILKNDAEKISQEIYEEELELDHSAENTLRSQEKRDYIYRNYIQNNAHKVLINDRCIFERQEIINALQKFSDSNYNLSDPRVYLIVNELVSNILQSGRANKTFTNLGVLLKKDTPSGPIYYKNPLLSIKIEFSRLIIESTEALDRILKSDEKTKAEKDFTDHILNQLGLIDDKKIVIEQENKAEIKEEALYK